MHINADDNYTQAMAICVQPQVLIYDRALDSSCQVRIFFWKCDYAVQSWNIC